MKYLNLDINHYLSDKDKGEKPIVILIKGAVIYLILLIVSILVTGKTHQTFYLLTYRYYCCILLNINYLYLLIPKIFCIFVKNN